MGGSVAEKDLTEWTSEGKLKESLGFPLCAPEWALRKQRSAYIGTHE